MLNRKTFLIREKVGFIKLSDTYDILDLATQEQVGIAKEKPGMLIHLLRMFIDKRMLPTQVSVYTGTDFEDESKLLFSLRRGFSFLRPKIQICDSTGKVVGFLKSKLLTLGGAFRVFDASENEVASVKGDWKGWNFRFLDANENEIGTITKKWAGIGKELFTTADNYAVSLNQAENPGKVMLLLAAGLAIDTVYKER